MSAKDQIKQIVDYFKREPQLKDKTDGMAEGLLLGAQLADDANELSKETDASLKALQREYTENGNGSQTTAEITVARDGELVLDDRLKRDFGNVNAQLAQTEILLNKIKNKNVYISDYPRLDSESDDTGRIQRAFDEANRLFEYSNVVGSSLYYQTIITVVFDSAFYKTSAVTTFGKGIRIKSKGHTIMEAASPDKTIDCFSGLGSSGVFAVKGFTLLGYKKAFTVSTGDVDVSLIKFEDVFFHSCSVGVDTVSFEESRSTLLIFENCKEWGTDTFLINYCDKAVINGGWLYHTGNGEANILNYNNLVIDGVIAVPKKVGNSRWIDNHETIGAQGGLSLKNSRFGAESGGIPVVYNYAKYSVDLQSNVGSIITIENCQTSSSGSKGVVHLIEMPNQINIKSVFGIFDNINGVITKEDTLDLSGIKNAALDYITLDLDYSVYQSVNFPKVAPELIRFLKENKPMPYSAKKENLYKLPTTPVSVPASGSQNIFKLGLVNSYTQAIIELDVTAHTHNSVYFCRKKVYMKVANGTTSNTVTTLSSVQVAEEYQSNTGYPVSFAIQGTIVNNLLEITVANQSGSVQNFVIEGKAILTYVGGNGRPVFLN